MALVAVYDANVLYGNEIRDLLIGLARSGVVQARWTNAILEEMTGDLAANRPCIPPRRGSAAAWRESACGSGSTARMV